MSWYLNAHFIDMKKQQGEADCPRQELEIIGQN